MICFNVGEKEGRSSLWWHFYSHLQFFVTRCRRHDNTVPTSIGGTSIEKLAGSIPIKAGVIIVFHSQSLSSSATSSWALQRKRQIEEASVETVLHLGEQCSEMSSFRLCNFVHLSRYKRREN